MRLDFFGMKFVMFNPALLHIVGADYDHSICMHPCTVIIEYACIMIIVHARTMIIVHAHRVSTTHMIPILVDDQLQIVSTFDTLCLPLLPDITQANKVDQMRDTSEKVKIK